VGRAEGEITVADLTLVQNPRMNRESMLKDAFDVIANYKPTAEELTAILAMLYDHGMVDGVEASVEDIKAMKERIAAL